MTRFILPTFLFFFLSIRLHASNAFTALLPMTSSRRIVAFSTSGQEQKSRSLALPVVAGSEVEEEKAKSFSSGRSFLPVGKVKTHRAGSWLPKDHAIIGGFLDEIRERVAVSQSTIEGACEPIIELDLLVRSDPALYGNVQAMFFEATSNGTETNYTETPLGTQPVQDWDEFLKILNYIVQNVAPEFFINPNSTDPAGLVAFPINAMLDWPMATLPGFAVFSNAGFNSAMQKVLTYWTTFLTSEESTYTLTSKCTKPPALAWLDPTVRKQLVDKANEAVNNDKTYTNFEDVFKCDPSQPAYGFPSWDAFFTREFNPDVRPVDDPFDGTQIANACESTPLQVVRNVNLTDKFWLKDQAYSLKNMIDDGPHQYARSFAGGTVYQAYLSALSFHQWRSPVSGTVVASYNINGTYFLQSYHKGFDDSDNGLGDPVAPNDSQPYLSSVASRSVIIIETDEEALGTVAFIAVGMAECGSCENIVKKGDRICKGAPIGMFHYGGSTHCLVFQPHVNLEFIPYIKTRAGIEAPYNVAVSSTIAKVICP